MITYPIYKLIHLLGIFLMFSSLAGIAFYTANGGTKDRNSLRKQAGIAHGIGLFLVLLGGFGMLAKLGITEFPFPVWVWIKLTIWVAFGGLVALASRKQDHAKILWWVIPFLAVFAAFVAIVKPF